jgi:hypothetical protein
LIHEKVINDKDLAVSRHSLENVLDMSFFGKKVQMKSFNKSKGGVESASCVQTDERIFDIVHGQRRISLQTEDLEGDLAL